MFFQKPTDGTQQRSGAVDGKHQDGSLSHHFGIVFGYGVESCEYDFHTPSCHTAFQKVLSHFMHAKFLLIMKMKILGEVPPIFGIFSISLFFRYIHGSFSAPRIS